MSGGRRGEKQGRRESERRMARKGGGRGRRRLGARGSDTTAVSEARQDRQLFSPTVSPDISPSLPVGLLLDPDAHVPSPMVLTSAFSELLGYISIACWVGAQFP